MPDGDDSEYVIEEKLETPSKFAFPFAPYGIQHDFMTEIYSAIEGKKLGIFESPTGTVSHIYIFLTNHIAFFIQHKSFILNFVSTRI